MSDRALYLRAAADLRENEGQWAAYESTGHCVILAGPGSGKTKTLTIKLARVLAEDVEAPRGVACITYNNECARELETRLDQLGVAALEDAYHDVIGGPDNPQYWNLRMSNYRRSILNRDAPAWLQNDP